MNNEQQKSISDAVLNKIKSKEVKMRPKCYFVLKTVLTISSIFVLALFVLYLISFIAFTLRASGIWFMSGFGFPGIKVFLSSLPWILILIAVTLIIALELLTKRFTFVYRKPIFYSMIVIIIFVLLGSFIIGKTQFHPNLFLKAEENRLPIAGKLYRDSNIAELKDVHRGIISEITNNGFYLEKHDGQTLNIVIIPSTKLLLKKEAIKGDEVVVMGKEHNGLIYAIAVKKINDNMKFLQQGPINKRLGK